MTALAWQPRRTGGSGEEGAARQEETNGEGSESVYTSVHMLQRCTLVCVCVCVGGWLCVCVCGCGWLCVGVCSSCNCSNGAT